MCCKLYIAGYSHDVFCLPMMLPKLNIFCSRSWILNKKVILNFLLFMFICLFGSSPPSQPSSPVHFHFVNMLSNIICRPPWSCHLWRKGHIFKVIAAMLISTMPPLIPGINHYCLWSLAPASTMVRLRLVRVATEYSCLTELDTYNDGWLVSMLYNIFYTLIQNFQISSE